MIPSKSFLPLLPGHVTDDNIRGLSTEATILCISYEKCFIANFVCRLRSFAGMCWMPSLQALYLQDNCISCVKAIHGAPNLTLLNLAFNQISFTASLKSLACMRSLCRLDLNGCPIELIPGSEALRIHWISHKHRAWISVLTCCGSGNRQWSIKSLYMQL